MAEPAVLRGIRRLCVRRRLHIHRCFLQPGAVQLGARRAEHLQRIPALHFTAESATFTGTIQSQNINFKPGIVQQFNVNVERQLPGDLVLTVGYAGARSAHILIDGNNLNVTTPNACAGGPERCRRLYLGLRTKWDIYGTTASVFGLPFQHHLQHHGPGYGALQLAAN